MGAVEYEKFKKEQERQDQKEAGGLDQEEKKLENVKEDMDVDYEQLLARAAKAVSYTHLTLPTILRV